MKRKSLTFALSYLVLVASPLLVFMGVLRSGRALVAPVSVGGLWRMQATDYTVAFPCGKQLVVADASFTISQSGKSFTLSFPRSTMSSGSGTVEGNNITATILPAAKWSKQAGCGPGHPLTLTATVDSSAKAHMLAGMLAADDCPTCAAIHFHAIREE